MNVLLVEDDSVDEQAVRRIMSSDSSLQCVVTLKDAIEATKHQQFNLILLDLGLPDSSGIDTFTSLREAAASVPIVVLTGVDDERMAIHAIREGAQDFLVKGYLDARALRSLGFAVERERLTHELLAAQKERRELEETLRERERELAHISRVALMGEVTAEIAHEISQPLQAIANLVSVLVLNGSEEKPESSHSNADLARQIDEAITLAQQILSRTRKFVRKSEVVRTSEDVDSVVRDTIMFVDFERRKYDIEVLQEDGETQLLALIDRVQIQQVLVNLFRNAFDAIKSNQQSNDRRIWVRCFREGQNIVVEVEDSGCGIQISNEEMFTAFVSTKADGLGMGLVVCSRILKDHDGSISAVRSERGTVLRITLPEHLA
jgi:C4-dicarboxylate-specific signal transduction histidine kinase